ncbi:MAG TPA: hypothetical protein VH518_17190 [Tepidisphaeraceae bacterium]|jgi:hypothetical protein
MRLSALAISTLVVLPLLGCDRSGNDQIQVNSVPKQPAPPAMQSSGMPTAAAPMTAPESSAEPVTWKLPEGWKQSPGGSQMRYATILVNEDPKVELTVVPLSGDSGGLLANVNRWENQLGLPPSSEQDLPKVASKVEAAGHQFDLVDLTGAQNRMLAASTMQDGRTWFFKMTGPAAVVEKQKANFDAFVKSVRFGGAEAPKMAQSDEAAADLSYDVPDGWTKEEPKPMRIVSFIAKTGDKQAELIVTKFPSAAAGGYLDNVNRWRGQAGLPPIQEGGQQPSKPVVVGGADGALFDFAGSEKRLLVAWVPKGQDWWFFKLAGPTDVVAQHQPAFDRFLTTVRFIPGAGVDSGVRPAQ